MEFKRTLDIHFLNGAWTLLSTFFVLFLFSKRGQECPRPIRKTEKLLPLLILPKKRPRKFQPIAGNLLQSKLKLGGLNLQQSHSRRGLSLIQVVGILAIILIIGARFAVLTSTADYSHVATASILKSNYLAESARDYYQHIYVSPSASGDVNEIFNIGDGDQFLLGVINLPGGVKEIGTTGLAFKNTAFEARTTFNVSDPGNIKTPDQSIILYVQANGQANPATGNVDDASAYHLTGVNYNFLAASTPSIYEADLNGNNPGAFLMENGQTKRVGLDAKTLSFPHDAKFNVGDEGTISILFKPEYLPYGATLLSKGAVHIHEPFVTSPAMEIDFNVRNTGNKKPQLRATLCKNSDKYPLSSSNIYQFTQEIEGTGNVPIAKWYHLVFTWRKGGLAPEFDAFGNPIITTFYNFYLAELNADGTPKPYIKKPPATLNFSPYTSTQPLNIGARYLGHGWTRTGTSSRDYVETLYGFNGKIDDVLLFNQAFKETDVDQLYSTGNYVKPTGKNDPVFSLRANGNTTDSSATPLAGTVYDFDGVVSTMDYGADAQGNAGQAFQFLATNTDPEEVNNATRGMHIRYENALNQALNLTTSGTVSIRYNPSIFYHNAYLIDKRSYRIYFFVNNASFNNTTGAITSNARTDLVFHLTNWDGKTERLTLTGIYPTDLATGTKISDANRKWYHVVITWDWTGIKLYHKAFGDAAYTIKERNFTALAQTYTNNMLVGAQRFTTTNLTDPGSNLIGKTTVPFEGLMDDLIMFNRALSQTEVEALYNASNVLTVSP